MMKSTTQVNLSSEQSRLESILDSLVDGLIVIDSRGTIEGFNLSAQRLFGYSEHEVLGMNIKMLMPAPFRDGHRKHVENYLSTGRKKIIGIGREVHCCRKDGSIFKAQLSVSEAVVDGSSIFTGIIRDISAQKAMEDELKVAVLAADQASSVKSEFLGNMSHELRTPLNGVMGMLELLKGTSLDRRQHGYVATAYSSAHSLLTVINSILDFSKIESGTLNIENVIFDARTTIEDSAIMAATDVAQKELEFNCLIAREVPRTLSGGAMQLQQIILNLVSNSVKFTEAGEINLRVSLAAMDDSKAQIRVEIEDTGIGIAETKLDSLFEPFTQRDSSTTRKYGGPGLGLTIVRRLIELMGGEIGVTSEEGRGTTFWFSLWFELVAPVDEFALSGFREDIRVLVVDDNKTNRDILLYYLSGWHIESGEATDGFTALTTLRQAATDGRPYHVVILDSQMPGMDSMELIELMRSDNSLASTEIMMLSSAGGSEQPLEQAGIRCSLVKPARQSDIYDGLRQLAGATPATGSEHRAGRGNEDFQFTGRRILIVDDTKTNQRVGKEMLRKLGLQADLADNGSEALEAIASRQYDLVLMDCQMPVMDGYAATREIRVLEKSMGPGRRLPIVAVTAHALEGDRETCLQAGMDDYLTKPLIFSELESMLHRWIPPSIE